MAKSAPFEKRRRENSGCEYCGKARPGQMLPHGWHVIAERTKDHKLYRLIVACSGQCRDALKDGL